MKQIRTLTITTGIITILLFVSSSAFSKPRPPQPPWPEATLRIYGFDSAVLPGPWKDVPINEESSVADSWSGQALVREGFVALSPVVIPVDVESKRPNFKMDGGAIRFWIAPNWSTADEKLAPPLVDLLREPLNCSPHMFWSLFQSIKHNMPSPPSMPDQLVPLKRFVPLSCHP